MINEIKKFEKKTKDYKDELFGVKLFYEGTKILWADSYLAKVFGKFLESGFTTSHSLYIL